MAAKQMVFDDDARAPLAAGGYATTRATAVYWKQTAPITSAWKSSW